MFAMFNNPPYLIVKLSGHYSCIYSLHFYLKFVSATKTTYLIVLFQLNIRMRILLKPYGKKVHIPYK